VKHAYIPSRRNDELEAVFPHRVLAQVETSRGLLRSGSRAGRESGVRENAAGPRDL
jgi:hypothetical protein